MSNCSGGFEPSETTGGIQALEPERPKMLIPQAALRMLCNKTGGNISRATFYRWLESGKIASIRLGARIFTPRLEMEDFIQKCFAAD